MDIEIVRKLIVLEKTIIMLLGFIAGFFARELII